MFFLAAGLIFTVAMFAAAYYVFTVPEQQAAQVLAGAPARSARQCSRPHPERAGVAAPRTSRQLCVSRRPGHLGRDPAPLAGDHRAGQPQIPRRRCVRLQRPAGGDGFRRCSVVAGGAFLLLRLLVGTAGRRRPIFYIVRVRGRRLRKFEEQLPDAIDLFTRTMRAGHNIHSGLETIANETADPVRMEFKQAHGGAGARLAGGAGPARPRQARPAARPQVLHHRPDSAAADRRQHGGRAGEPFHAGARASQHGRQAARRTPRSSAFRPACCARCPWSSAWDSIF